MKRLACLLGRHHPASKERQDHAEKHLRLYGLGIEKLNTVRNVNNKIMYEKILSECLLCSKVLYQNAYWSGDEWLMIRDYLSTHPHLKYQVKSNRYTSNLWNGDPYAIELAIIQGNKV